MRIRVDEDDFQGGKQECQGFSIVEELEVPLKAQGEIEPKIKKVTAEA